MLDFANLDTTRLQSADEDYGSFGFISVCHMENLSRRRFHV